ncbi:hypothetical protein BD779DRAFT_1565515 [Infundibulicybe gibba]|nr:hypothetical protein BD779DRAFT_1565515 [Infundibulicybe gibba]
MSNILMPERAGISRIPHDILQKIFIGGSVDPSQTSKVCRFWRALVLATPALWASLDITCNFAVLRPSLPIIRAHLQRSGVYPLSFILRADKKKLSLNKNPNLLPVLKTLTAARHRWRNVHIKLVWMTRDILNLITLGDAPPLRSIKYDTRASGGGLRVPPRMLHHCPRLGSFRWNSFESEPLLLPRFNTSLTSLSLQASLSVSKCNTLLRFFPSLSSARFYSINIFDFFPARRLTHPTLRTLIAEGKHSVVFLTPLTLPALLNLDLRTKDAKTLPKNSEVILSAFLKRSNPRLHTLSLSTSYMRSLEPAVLRILALTPHLRSLRLEDPSIYPSSLTAAVIRALHPPPPPGAPLCPRLHRLDLFRVSDCPDGLCTAMLRARWGAQAHANGVACLEWVNIDLEGGVHDHDQMDMKELRAEGLQGEVNLRDPGSVRNRGMV